MNKLLVFTALFCLTTFLSQSQVLFQDFNPNGDANPQRLTICDGFLYFRVIDNNTGTYSLYRTDGTQTGTVILKNYQNQYLPTFLTCVDTLLYFTNQRTGHYELWRTNGTTGGTYDLDPLGWGGSASPNNFTNYNKELYFSLNDRTLTKLEYDLNTPILNYIESYNKLYGRQHNQYDYSRFPIYLDHFIFTTEEGSFPSRTAVFNKSDGTFQGTKAVKTLTFNGNAIISEFVESGAYAYFDSQYKPNANATSTGIELFRTDGTENGTRLVKDIYQGTGLRSSSWPRDLTDVNGTLFFRANDGIHGEELWKSQGEEANTLLVKDINPLEASFPKDLVFFNDLLYFSASSDSLSGRELWRSDGTDTGTVMIKDINLSGSSNPQNLFVVGDLIYFSADDGVNGQELWQTDGSTIGTELVGNINPAGSSNPDWFTFYNNTLFFVADDGTSGRELWTLELNPLPVELFAFNASLLDNDIMLDWTSIAEVNHDNYIIEHCIDSKNFNPLGKINGLGTQSNGHKYQFIHENPPLGDNYYRLKLVDIEGYFKYSKIVSISKEIKNNEIYIQPTIARDKIRVSLSEDFVFSQSKQFIEVWDIYGRLVKQINLAPKRLEININISSLQDGHYFVLLRDKNQILANQRFIKN